MKSITQLAGGCAALLMCSQRPGAGFPEKMLGSDHGNDKDAKGLNATFRSITTHTPNMFQITIPGLHLSYHALDALSPLRGSVIAFFVTTGHS